MAESWRSVTEVLKWSDPKATLETAAQVSALWSRVCDSSELWNDYIETQGLAEGFDPSIVGRKTAFREAYRTMMALTIVVLPSAHFVKIYDCKKRLFVRNVTMPSLIFSNFSAIVLLSSKTMLVCGGNRSLFNAQMCSLDTGQVQTLPDMLNPRDHHSAVFYKQVVYVFGCNSPPISRTAECFSVPQNNWKRLPDMLNSRWSFNACRKNQTIYLCGGNTLKCETFDTSTYIYNSINFDLPEGNWTVSFFYKNQLVSIIENRLLYLKADGWRPVKVRMPYVSLGNAAAIVHEDFVYFQMIFCSVVIELNMTNLEGKSYRRE